MEEFKEVTKRGPLGRNADAYVYSAKEVSDEMIGYLQPQALQFFNIIKNAPGGTITRGELLNIARSEIKTVQAIEKLWSFHRISFLRFGYVVEVKPPKVVPPPKPKRLSKKQQQELEIAQANQEADDENLM